MAPTEADFDDLLFDDGLCREQYEIKEEVGHGRFSEVYKAREKATGRTVAVKHMGLSEPGQLPKHVERELDALRSVRHPNVVALLDTHQKGMGVSLVLEHCVCDLRRALRLLGEPGLPPVLAKSVMQQLLRAINACHQAGFMHRDVSPSNVLLEQGTGLIKLADFGQARRPEEAGGSSPSSHAGSLSPIVGTRWYKAPELMFGSRSYTPAVDLWSVACVFAELLTGRPLFPGSSDIDQICRINGVLGSIDEEDWPGVRELPDWGKLVFPAAQRRALAEVLPEAPPAALELLQGLLQYNPERRLSADSALRAAYFLEEPAPAPPAELASLVEQLLAPTAVEGAGSPEDIQSLASFLRGASVDQEGALPALPGGFQMLAGWPAPQ